MGRGRAHADRGQGPGACRLVAGRAPPGPVPGTGTAGGCGRDLCAGVAGRRLRAARVPVRPGTPAGGPAETLRTGHASRLSVALHRPLATRVCTTPAHRHGRRRAWPPPLGSGAGLRLPVPPPSAPGIADTFSGGSESQHDLAAERGPGVGRAAAPSRRDTGAADDRPLAEQGHGPAATTSRTRSRAPAPTTTCSGTCRTSTTTASRSPARTSAR